MRILLTTLVALQLASGILYADDTNTDQSEADAIQVGQKVVLDRDGEWDVGDGDPLPLKRGTVLTVLAIDGDRIQACDLAPIWVNSSDVLSLRDARRKIASELEKNPKDPVLLNAMGNIFRALGIHDCAADIYCQVLSRDDDNLDARRGRADAYHDAFGPRRCFDNLECTTKDSPDDAWSHYLLGKLLIDHVKYNRAMIHLDKALTLAPKFVAALVARAEAHWRLGDGEKALADYDEALRLCPSATAALVGRAQFRISLGNFKAAAEDLRKALELNPNDASAHHEMAQLIIKAGDESIGTIKQAVEHAKKATDLTDGQDICYARGLSDAYLACGDTSRGMDWKMHALRLAIARKNYYRGWQAETAFRHGKPRHWEWDENQDKKDQSAPAN